MNKLTNEDTFSTALNQPQAAISYSISKGLAALYPDRYVLDTESGAFDLEEFEIAGHCKLVLKSGIHNQIETSWQGTEYDLSNSPIQAWHTVSWQSHELEVLRVRWPAAYCNTTGYWIIAANREIADGFFRAVCHWNSEVRGEVLVFEQGYWQKSKTLYDAIDGASYDQVILAGDLKQQIHEDFARFFASRDTYNRYGVPWKRGALFIGPPGNGKTQMVKAIIKAVSVPCLYVKSLTGDRNEGHANVRQVFDRARKTTPCFLVLEDLDSLVNAGNRSFFLNELDGFASNTGIVVLATTNHPEKLDPAILDRPSRFDRKYHFDLPQMAERNAYLELWNAGLEPELKLSTQGLSCAAELTEAFSFAYLKELMLSSVMAWMENPHHVSSMDRVVLEQAALLRDQMAYIVDETPSVEIDPDDEIE